MSEREIASYYAELHYNIDECGSPVMHYPGVTDGMIGIFRSLGPQQAGAIQEALDLKAKTLSDRHSVTLSQLCDDGKSLLAIQECQEIMKCLIGAVESDFKRSDRLALARFAKSLGATAKPSQNNRGDITGVASMGVAIVAAARAMKRATPFTVTVNGKSKMFNPGEFSFLGSTENGDYSHSEYFEKGERVFRVTSNGHCDPTLEEVEPRDAVRSLFLSGQNVPDHLSKFVPEFQFNLDDAKPLVAQETNAPAERLRVTESAIYIDGNEFPFKGGEKGISRLHSFFTELVNSQDYVTMKAHSLRTEDIEKQAPKVKELFSESGGTTAGFRICKTWFEDSEVGGPFNESEIPF